MSNYQNSNRIVTRRSNGFFEDLTNRFRLISRLLMDSRVNPLIKLLPVATLAYVVWPVDLLPVNPVDDAFIIWVGTSLFVELCPPQVVDEHLKSLRQRLNQEGGSGGQDPTVVDGEYVEVDPSQKR